MKRSLFLTTVFCLAMLLLARPAAAAAAPPEVITLPSGATLIISPETDSPLAVIDIFFRVGYAEEQQAAADPGITSLLSRAWISQSEARGEELLGADIVALGGNVGASFGGDYTELYAVTLATEEAFQKAAQTLILNVIGQPTFPEAAVEEARQSQLRALQLENDQLLADTLSRLRRRLWDLSPYTRSPLGTPESVRAITAQKVRTFYNKYFRPDRAVIVVAGNIPSERVRRIVEANISASGWAGNRPKSPPVAALAPESLSQTPPDVNVSRRARITFMMAGFLAPGTRQAAADYPALLLLEALVGGGKSSRLFRNLRDTKGIGYEVGSLLQPGMYQGLLAGYVATVTSSQQGPNGAPLSNPSDVSRSLIAEMKSLAARPPDEAEIARARALVKGRYALRHERLKERAFLLGWSEVMGLGAAFDTTFDARLDAVTPADLQRVIKSVLGGNHVLSMTLPEP